MLTNLPLRGAAIRSALIISACAASSLSADDLLSSENFDISGEVRLRYVDRNNAGDVNRTRDFSAADIANDNDFLYLRSTVAVDYTVNDQITAYVALRDQRAFNDLRDPSPRQDWLDVYQAKVSLKTDNIGEFILGRQEVSYGSRLLIGTPNYRNGRSYDGAQYKTAIGDYSLNLAAGRLVERDREKLNSSANQPWMFGAFFNALSKDPDSMSWDLTAAIKHVSARAGNPADIGALGLRLKSPKNHAPWFWTAEAAIQDGSVNRGGTRIDHEAWLFTGRVGRKFEHSTWKPQVFIEYLHSPGDSDATDGKNETWDLMFSGGNHPRSGRMDLTGWRNMQSISFTTTAKPSKTVSLGFSQSGFWMETTQDGFYGQGGGAPRNGNGYGINPGFSRELGWETMLWVSWKPKKNISILAEAGNFSTGDYIDQSLASTGGSKDAQVLYLTTAFKF